jgi:hypothetical protein
MFDHYEKGSLILRKYDKYLTEKNDCETGLSDFASENQERMRNLEGN